MDNENSQAPLSSVPVSAPLVNTAPAASEPQTSASPNVLGTPMPSITDLFTESWQVFKRSFVNLFVLNVLSWILIIGLCGGLLLMLAVFGGFSAVPAIIGSAQVGSDFNPALLIPFFGVLAVLGLIGFIGFVIIGSVLQTGTILVIANSSDKISFGDVIKRSVGFIIPLAVVGFVTGLLTFGALFVFFFPALIFVLFFMFSSYEVVLGGKRGLDALRSSAYIMQKRFADVFVRLVAFVLIYFCFALANMFVAAIGSVVRVLETPLSLLYYAANAVLGWYAAAFSITLYRQAKNGLSEGFARLRWFGVTSIIGWVFFFLIFVGILVMAAAVGTGRLYDDFGRDSKTYPEITRTPDWYNKDVVPTIGWDSESDYNNY